MGTELTTQKAITVSDAEKLAKTIALAEHGANALEKSAGNNMLKIMIGEDMGIGPGAALRGIHIVKGKPELSGALWGALIDNSPDYKYRVIQTDDKVASIEFSRKEEQVWEVRGTETFTMDMAKVAGLAGNDTYKKYPTNMLWWRAMSNGARKFCPGLTMGAAYAEGELSEGIELPPEPMKVVSPTKSPQDMLGDRIAVCATLKRIENPTDEQQAEQRRAHKDLLDIQKTQLELPESKRMPVAWFKRLDKLIDIPVPE